MKTINARGQLVNTGTLGGEFHVYLVCTTGDPDGSPTWVFGPARYISSLAPGESTPTMDLPPITVDESLWPGGTVLTAEVWISTPGEVVRAGRATWTKILPTAEIYDIQSVYFDGMQWQGWEPIRNTYPVGISLYLGTTWVNTSDETIAIRAEVQVTYPNGGLAGTQAELNQDRSADPGSGWMVTFDSISLNQSGNYQVRVKLFLVQPGIEPQFWPLLAEQTVGFDVV